MVKVMIITRIETLTCDAGWRPWLFVKIHTDGPLVGYSECTESNGSYRGIIGAIRDLEKFVLGKNPLAYEKIYWDMYAATRQSPGGVVQKAIGGIQNALLDIAGKHYGVPVYELFGGPIRERIPVYWSHWATSRVRAAHHVRQTPVVTLEDVAKLVEETKLRGFSAIKTNAILFDGAPKVYMPGFGKSAGGPELDISPRIINNLKNFIAQIRQTGGEDFEIMLDLGVNFRVEGYIRIARVLEPYKLSWLEVDVRDPKALCEIRKRCQAPICTGEDLYTMREFRPFFENYSMDIANIDVIWNGFGESKKIADAAESFEVNVVPHNFYSHLSTFISANFAAAVPNLKIMEVDIDDVPWREEIITEVPKIENGQMMLPTKPGWGTDLREDMISLHKVAV